MLLFHFGLPSYFKIIIKLKYAICWKIYDIQKIRENVDNAFTIFHALIWRKIPQFFFTISETRLILPIFQFVWNVL